jgi:hypothetical protein
MNVDSIFHLYASFSGEVKQVLSGLAEELLIGNFFEVVVPVPDFYSVAGAVGDDGFALERGVVAEEYGFFRVKPRATSRSVVESLASAVSRVWLTYWRVVLSLSAMAETDKPLRTRDQTVFCFWLRGEVREQAGHITVHVNNWVFTHI